MTWQDKILFHIKARNGEIARTYLDPLLMGGASAYSEAMDRLRELLHRGFVERVESKNVSIRLTSLGDELIGPIYSKIQSGMKRADSILHGVVDNILQIMLQSGITGIHFMYKSAIFRFHPDVIDGQFVLLARMPNLPLPPDEYRDNILYISKDILDKTRLLEDIVRAYLRMLDVHSSVGPNIVL